MLCLSRREGQEIDIGDGVRIVIGKMKGNTVRILIDAPQSVRIARGELRGRLETREAERLAELAAENEALGQARREAEAREAADWERWHAAGAA
jgi:carbon storage regulator CsrA